MRVLRSFPIAFAVMLGAMQSAPSFAQEAVGYARDIKPILDANCVECHHYSSRYVDLSQFPFVAPWTTDQGEIVETLLGRVSSSSERMPPGGRTQLGADERALISAWLEQGLQP